MAAHDSEHRTEKEKAADEARKAWWSEERKAEKSKWRKEQNKSDELRQKISNGCLHNKRSNKLR